MSEAPPCRCVTGALTGRDPIEALNTALFERDNARSDVTDLAWEIEMKWRPELAQAKAESHRLRTLIHSYQLAIIGEDGRDFDARMAAFSALVEAVGP